MSAPSPDVHLRLRAGLATLGLAPQDEVLESLVRFLQLLEKWNRAFNLTAITDLDDMVTRHVLDAATALPCLKGSRVLDVGSGAGLPGIPLALLAPAPHFSLLEATGKKASFLRQALATLPVRNAEVVQARVEAFAPEALFDTVICRAFASLGEFVAAAGHLVAPGGRLVAMKGRHPAEELAAVPGPWRTAVTRVAVPGLDAERHLVVMEH